MHKSTFEFFLLLASLIFISTITSNAQSFSFVPDEVVLSDTLESDITFTFNVTNISSNPLTLYYVKRSESAPEPWTTSFCTTVCFPSHIDSVVTNSDFNDTPFSPGEEREMSFHIYAQDSGGVGYYTIVAGDFRNPFDTISVDLTASTEPTSIEETGKPGKYFIAQNYPNPFNPSTTIRYEIPDAGFVSIKVFDLLGEEVAQLVNGQKEAGRHTLEFNAANLGSGVYFYVMTSGNFKEVKKMILLR